MSSYERVNWKNTPETPINDANLNIMDKGIEDAHNGVNVPIFASSDALDTEETPLEWSNVEVLKSGEKHSLILAKISAMFRNIRYLYKSFTRLNGNFNDDVVINRATGPVNPANISEHLLTADLQHLISIVGIGTTSIANLNIKIDAKDIGFVPITPNNYRVMQISMGTNPTTSKRALIINWYADGREYTSYVDVTN